MITVTIDEKTTTVQPGATILEAARALGVEIPTLCHFEGHPPCASCMVCAVRVEGKERLLPACAALAEEGMVVRSDDPAVRAARRQALEMLLGDHLGDCYAPCQRICPLHADIPVILRQISAGDFAGAAAFISSRFALPKTTCALCPAPCERGCRRGQQDGAVSIRAMIRALSAHIEPPECVESSGKSVAVIGGGPAGLSAAHSLRLAGHVVTVFDEAAFVGGRLHAFLAKSLDDDIAHLQKMGVTFALETCITEGDLDWLRGRFTAVLLATGSDSVFAGAQFEQPGVFVAGDAASEQRDVIRAMASGAHTARCVDALFRNIPSPPARPWSSHLGKLDEEEILTLMTEASPTPRMPEGAEISEELLRAEGARCLHCDCRKLESCDLRRLSEELGATPATLKGTRHRFSADYSHHEIIFEPGKCICCERCVRITAAAGEPFGLAMTSRGFDVRPAPALGVSLAQAVTVSTREVVEGCPTGAFGWR